MREPTPSGQRDTSNGSIWQDGLNTSCNGSKDEPFSNCGLQYKGYYLEQVLTWSNQYWPPKCEPPSKWREGKIRWL